MAIGYKRLERTANNRWYSCFQLPHKGGRTYRVGVPTKPKLLHGPLCVFATRRQANEFFSGTHVALCKYRKSRRKTAWFFPWGKGRKRMRDWFPTGTVLADSVTLLEDPRPAPRRRQ